TRAAVGRRRGCAHSYPGLAGLLDSLRFLNTRRLELLFHGHPTRRWPWSTRGPVAVRVAHTCALDAIGGPTARLGPPGNDLLGAMASELRRRLAALGLAGLLVVCLGFTVSLHRLGPLVPSTRAARSACRNVCRAPMSVVLTFAARLPTPQYLGARAQV